jgi:hypothetical protein
MAKLDNLTSALMSPSLLESWTNTAKITNVGDFTNQMAFTKSNSRLSTMVRNEDISTTINKKLFSTASPKPPPSSRCNRGSTSSKGKKWVVGSQQEGGLRVCYPRLTHNFIPNFIV